MHGTLATLGDSDTHAADMIETLFAMLVPADNVGRLRVEGIDGRCCSPARTIRAVESFADVISPHLEDTMPFDFLVARICCPACLEEVDAEIQTHLRGGLADGSALGMGSELEVELLDPAHILGCGYAIVRPSGDTQSLRLLDLWSCPSCETEQWASVEITGGRISRIDAVNLDRKTLGAVHYVADLDADLIADSLRGDGDAGATSIAVLLRRLS